MLDTRPGLGPVGPGKLAADAVLELPIAGVTGVPDGATGVLLNTTVTETAVTGSYRVGLRLTAPVSVEPQLRR